MLKTKSQADKLKSTVYEMNLYLLEIFTVFTIGPPDVLQQ